LDSPWILGQGSLVLNRWTSGFDSEKEPFYQRHLWLMLPGLPIQLWTKEILQKVAKMIGKYIFLDDGMFFVRDKRIAYVLVE